MLKSAKGGFCGEKVKFSLFDSGSLNSRSQGRAMLKLSSSLAVVTCRGCVSLTPV